MGRDWSIPMLALTVLSCPCARAGCCLFLHFLVRAIFVLLLAEYCQTASRFTQLRKSGFCPLLSGPESDNPFMIVCCVIPPCLVNTFTPPFPRLFRCLVALCPSSIRLRGRDNATAVFPLLQAGKLQPDIHPQIDCLRCRPASVLRARALMSPPD